MNRVPRAQASQGHHRASSTDQQLNGRGPEPARVARQKPRVRRGSGGDRGHPAIALQALHPEILTTSSKSCPNPRRNQCESSAVSANLKSRRGNAGCLGRATSCKKEDPLKSTERNVCPANAGANPAVSVLACVAGRDLGFSGIGLCKLRRKRPSAGALRACTARTIACLSCLLVNAPAALGIPGSLCENLVWISHESPRRVPFSFPSRPFSSRWVVSAISQFSRVWVALRLA